MSLLQTISHSSLLLPRPQLGWVSKSVCSRRILFPKSQLTSHVAYNAFKKIEAKFIARDFSNSSIIPLNGISWSNTRQSYRSLEEYGWQISAIKKGLEKLEAKKEEILQKLSTIPEREEIINIQEEQLACIKDPHCRKFVYLVFQYLSNIQELSILELPMLFILKQPIKYREDSNGVKGFVHPLLVDLCKKYYEETDDIIGGYHHFGKVVKYLQILKDSNLSVLKRHCLNEELDNLYCIINFYKINQLPTLEKNYKNGLDLHRSDPEGFRQVS